MSKTTGTLAEEVSPGVPVGGRPAPSREEIQRQLLATLASPSFHGSKRCQQFLEYVCSRSLAGDAGALKERNVAIEVFGRHPDSGLGEDTIVRVGAREVRKRLAQYYASAGGAAAPVIIDLPLGSYVPEFRFPAQPSPATLATAVLDPLSHLEPVQPSSPATRASRRWAFYAVGAAIAIAACTFAVAKWKARPALNPAFEAFWAPVMQAATPLLVGVGHPIVYMPSHRATLLNEQRLPALPYPAQRPLSLSPKELDGSDIVAVENQFVGFGDMVAGNDVSQMLARRGTVSGFCSPAASRSPTCGTPQRT